MTFARTLPLILAALVLLTSNRPSEQVWKIEFRIYNLMTTGSTTVTNVAVINSTDSCGICPATVESNGGSFGLNLKSSSDSFIRCKVFLTIQNIGDFKMEIENSLKSKTFDLKGNSIEAEGSLQFNCQEILWQIQTVKDSDTYTVLVILNDPDCESCSG